MDNTPSPESSEQTAATPAAETLQPRSDTGTPATVSPPTSTPIASAGSKRRHTYRPSHKATFIALGVVIVIVAVNAVVLGFVLKNKSKSDDQVSGQVSISADVLSKIGVNKSTLGSSGVQLTVDPDAKFNGTVTTASDLSIGGQLKLTGKLNSNEAGIARLEAGNTSLSQLDVNGNTNLSSLLLRTNLTVNGTAQLQGAVTIAQLLTVNNSLNVAGNVAVGGTLTTGAFVARNLASTSTLTIGGHIITSGPAPGVGPGSALGSNGTVAISGNDSAGTISINIGTGSSGGTLVSVSFRTQFSTTPRIVISPVGVAGNFYVSNPSVGGFSVGVGSGLPIGGYAINYIVQQ
jgi:cytoskeletal protein CcmA (bactofilin family)